MCTVTRAGCWQPKGLIMALIWISIKQFTKEAIQLYFAPLTGAIRGIKHEYKRLDREHRNARRAIEETLKQRQTGR